MKNPPSFCVVEMEPDFWHAQKKLLFLKNGCENKKAKNALKIAAHAKSAVFCKQMKNVKMGAILQDG